MLKKLFRFSFALFFVLPLVSIFIKLVMQVQVKFIIIDVVVVLLCGIVFGVSSFVVYRRRNKIKRINEYTIPYLLTMLVVAFFAIRLLLVAYSDDLIFGYFDNKFDYRLTLLYLVLLVILVVQFIGAFVWLQKHKQPTKNIFLPTTYKMVVGISIFDIVTIVIAIIAKVIAKADTLIFDVIYLGSLAIFYLSYVFIAWVLNKFRYAQNMFASVSIIIPIVTSLIWVIVVFLPVDFWQFKFLYILLGIINIVVLILFWHTSTKGKNRVQVFDDTSNT